MVVLPHKNELQTSAEISSAYADGAVALYLALRQSPPPPLFPPPPAIKKGERRPPTPLPKPAPRAAGSSMPTDLTVTLLSPVAPLPLRFDCTQFGLDLAPPGRIIAP